MDTGHIDQQKVLAASRSWSTAEEIVEKLSAPTSAHRKVMAILRVLAGLGKVEYRTRELKGRGRPPYEFRRAS